MSHHAYLIIAPQKEGVLRAYAAHNIEPESVGGNPDIQVLTYPVFGIDDARKLQEWSFQKPTHGERRLFVICAESITHETQNALLKLFEEPPRTSTFAIVVPDLERILPTLRSRFETIIVSHQVGLASAKNFLALNPGERLKEIAVRTKNKDTVWEAELLASLEEYFYGEGAKVNGVQIHGKPLRALAFVQGHIGKRGSSPKMLLEYLALVAPQA